MAGLSCGSAASAAMAAGCTQPGDSAVLTFLWRREVTLSSSIAELPLPAPVCAAGLERQGHSRGILGVLPGGAPVLEA